MSDLRSLLPDLAAEIERLVDERIEMMLSVRETPDAPPAWMSIEEASAYLRVSRSSIERLLKQGRLGSAYVGRRRVIRRTDLDSVRN